MTRIVRRHPDEDIQLWFEDGARVGQKGCNAHVQSPKGQRPVAPTDKGFRSVYIYGATRAGTDRLRSRPAAPDTAMMSLFLEIFSAGLAPKVHAVFVTDKTGG